MMVETPMKRISEKKIQWTIDDMVKQLTVSAENVQLSRNLLREKDTLAQRQVFAYHVAKVRTLADEILRWELL